MPSPLAPDLLFARRNYVVFCQVVMPDETTNAPVVLQPHQRALIDVLDLAWEEGKHCFLLAPIRHGKTTLLEAAVIYMLGTYRWTRTKVASANQDVAKERTAKIRRLLKESGRVRALYPDLRITAPDRPERIYVDRAGEVARDPALHAVGVSVGVTGSSVDVLLLDDVDDPRTQSSSRRRRIVQTGVLEGLLSRCEPGTVVAAIASRWHPKDCYGVVLEDEGMRSRWVLYQEATADDLSHIKGQCVGDTRSVLLPLGWRAVVRPDDLDDLDDVAGADDVEGDRDDA